MEKLVDRRFIERRRRVERFSQFTLCTDLNRNIGCSIHAQIFRRFKVIGNEETRQDSDASRPDPDHERVFVYSSPTRLFDWIRLRGSAFPLVREKQLPRRQFDGISGSILHLDNITHISTRPLPDLNVVVALQIRFAV